ncbi:hypothetical protein [Halopiger thermotolerans]
MTKFENSIHYLSFADRPAIEENADQIDSIILTSHLVAYGSGKVPTLLNELRKEHDTRFYINPAITNLRVGTNFLDDQNDELSPWYQKYIEILGEKVQDLFDDHTQIQYENLTQEERESICKSTADFQENFVKDAAENSTGKYDFVVDDLRPEAIIPWYHKITEPKDIPRNRELAQLTNQATNLPIKPCLFITPDFITDSTNRDSLIESVKKIECSEIFLWVEGFDKSSGIGTHLNILKIVDELSEIGIGVHSLYGSYFSHLLAYFGATGVGFGVYHSESKSEKKEESGGDGSNLKRYYFDPVKEFLNVADVDTLTDLGSTPICSCNECQSTLSSWDDLFEVGEDPDFLQSHYISTRGIHKNRIFDQSLQESLEEVKEAESTYKETLNELGTSKTGNHLRKWRRSIEIYAENHSTKNVKEVLDQTI